MPADPMLRQKNSDSKPAKIKELLCFVPKASYFFMIAPTNKSKKQSGIPDTLTNPRV
jgi:hypothetical protein